MPHSTENRSRSWARRALSAFLALILLVGIVPASVLPASAAHWADEYLNQLVDWGFMRADQIGNPDEPINRAQFVAIINRAYGYSEMGPIPFADVPQTEWFYDDISIAYTAGYMAGTSSATADPYGYLTREMATCILGRNMMMKDSPAESLAFTDSWMVSSWARGLVKTAVDNYVLSGYPDNSFRPQSFVSMGEMAVLVTRCVGTPINEPGEYTLGDVFDNVTITSSNVTLRDTTISGDLYVSGGVGLGDVKLENVTVLGRIIVSGTGESEKGDASVLLRNVTAQEMLVDNMRDKTVTVRAEGLTEIGRTSVRTNAYLEDNTPDENGLRLITVDGSGCRLDLAGRVKEVVAQAPMTTVQVAKGTVQRLTVDETATNSTVQVNRNTEVKELNLDVASSVTGDGDVKQMNINAPGVTSTVLPEKLYIRPGITGNVGGEDLDSAGAEEYSRDPKILSGYPIASDIAPTSLRADFATNKKGTVYWAISNITDGSVSADDLIKPPSYGSSAVKNGSIDVPTAETLASAQITGLTVSGSYYLSAVMADRRGVRSPVKVISFTTPDNTKPAFAQGYPKMTLVTDTLAQAVVMPTKSCKLYYAVLPQGAPAPTTNELRSASVTGNLGYGVLDVIKNTELTFIASRQLEELKDYVLYLWLCDADGVNSSNVQSLRFKTVDATPPKFDPEASVADVGQTNVNLTVGLNEPGTVYWAVVPRGEAYPKPNLATGHDDDNEEGPDGTLRAKLTTDYAKGQVKNGRFAVKKGSVRITNASTEVPMNITGLAKETAYDLYYVGQDAAGNFTEAVQVIAINTLDNTPPTVRQYFSRYAGKDNTRDPLATTDIILEFSEDIRSSTGAGGGKSLLDLYADVASTDQTTSAQARSQLTDFLKKSITLYQTSTSTTPIKITEWNGSGDPPDTSWINFNNAVVSSKNGKVLLTLPYDGDEVTKSAHSLGSGSTYFFRIANITDNSDAQNAIVPNPVDYETMGTDHNIPTFTTVFAQVHLSVPTLATDGPVVRAGSPDLTGKDNQAFIDYTFRMIPDSTKTVDAANSYDLQIYSGSNIGFDLYCRINNSKDGKGDYITDTNAAKEAGITPKDGADKNKWFYLGNSGEIIQPPEGSGIRGVSVGGNNGMGGLQNFPSVNKLNQNYTYDFVVTVTSQAGVKERGVWTGDVDIQIHVLAGASNDLLNLASNVTEKRRNEYTSKPLTSAGLVSIGQTTSGEKFLALGKTFIDTRLPLFNENFPEIKPGDSFADINVSMDRAGTIYYVAAPLGGINTQGNIGTGSFTGQDLWEKLPEKGQNKLVNGIIQEKYFWLNGNTEEAIKITAPSAQDLMNPNNYKSYVRGTVAYEGGGVTTPINLRGLTPERDYILYFVLKGVSDTPSQVYAYRFTTNASSKPKIKLTDRKNGNVTLDTSSANSATESIPSDLAWIVFTRDVGKTTLEELKIGDIKINDSSDPDNPDKAFVATYDGKATMSPLDALTTTFDNSKVTFAAGATDAVKSKFDRTKNGYSVFDMFATGPQKRALQLMITTPASYDRISDSSKYTAKTEAPSYSGVADWLLKANLETPPASSSTFLILVCGHNTASNVTDWATVDSFAALNDVVVRDSKPPKLKENDVTGTLNYDPTTKTLNGAVRIVFDKNLYWRKTKEDDKLYMVIGGDTGEMAGANGGVGTIGLGNSPSVLFPTGLSISDGEGPRSGFSLVFKDVNVTSGTITLLDKGFFTNESTVATDDKLSITFNIVSPGNSGLTIKKPYCEVRFGSQVVRIEGALYDDAIGGGGANP